MTSPNKDAAPVRATISLPTDIYQAAIERQKAFRYGSFSAYVTALIDEDVTSQRDSHTRFASPDSTSIPKREEERSDARRVAEEKKRTAGIK
jgi:hypothetical protein